MRNSCKAAYLLIVFFCSVQGYGAQDQSPLNYFSYLLQAASGQLALLQRARPIAEVLADSRTPEFIKAQLKEITLIKAFGESQGLTPTSNYKKFVQVPETEGYGSAVVWVVTASDSLKFKAKAWSFPIVGSFNYLGWYSRNDAVQYAKSIQDQATQLNSNDQTLDVDIRGADAYSTLGWLEDPIYSSMLQPSLLPEGNPGRWVEMEQLINVVIHESVHASVYVSDQSPFNEALANFVAEKLTAIYLKEKKVDAFVLESLEKQKQLHLERVGLLQGAAHELNSVYESTLTNQAKRVEKEKIFTKLEEKLSIDRSKRRLNNATLIQYLTYESFPEEQKAFEKLWLEARSCKAFLKILSALKPSSFSEVQQERFASVLKALL